MMIPGPFKCNSCEQVVPRGTVVRGVKQESGKSRWNITVFRFHVACPFCSAEITIRTDAAIGAYVLESGASVVEPGAGLVESGDALLDYEESSSEEDDKFFSSEGDQDDSSSSEGEE